MSDLKNPYKRNTHQTDYYGIMYMNNGLYQTPEQVLGLPRRLQSSATKLGDIAYEDINGDGKIDGEDQVRWGMPTAPHSLTVSILFWVTKDSLCQDCYMEQENVIWNLGSRLRKMKLYGC